MFIGYYYLGVGGGRAVLWCLSSKKSACNPGDLGLIPELGKSPGEGNSYPLQYSCLENSMERGALWAPVHGVARIAEELATKLPPSFFFFLSYKYLYYCQIQHVSLIVCLCLPMCSIQIISLSAYAPHYFATLISQFSGKLPKVFIFGLLNIFFYMLQHSILIF